jgi:hypothetical protein
MRTPKWIGLGLLWATQALTGAETSYDVIVARNAFALRSSSPVASEPPVAPGNWTPPPDLKITALITVPPAKKCALYVVEHGKPPKSYVLGEGEQQDNIEVVNINGSSQTVRVKNQGVYVVLDFKTHGLKPGGSVGSALPGVATAPAP